MRYTKNSVCMYMYVLSRDAICRTGSQCVVHWKTDRQTVMKTTPPLPSAWITIPEAKLKIIWTRNLQQIIKIYCAFDEAVLATSLEGELSRLQGPRSHGVQGFIWPHLFEYAVHMRRLIPTFLSAIPTSTSLPPTFRYFPWRLAGDIGGSL